MHDDSGGDFFLACENFGRMFEYSHPARAVEIGSRIGSAHSGSASWDDFGRVFLDELRVSSLPDRSPHCAWTAAYSAHSDFVGSRVYACLGVTCDLHFWQNDRSLLRATVVTRGVGTDTE